MVKESQNVVGADLCVCPALGEHTGSPLRVTRHDNLAETLKSSGKSSGKISTVGKTVGKILRLLQENPTITRKKLHEETGLSLRGVEWNLAKMKKHGLIKRIGSARAGHWEVVHREK